MIVLSLFDGISAGRVSLERAGIQVDKYYASEIDKYAIAITQHNYPDTIQLGDVQEWESWDIFTDKIDLILAGSPCQGFSPAGDGLNFDDPRSKLFFTFVDILKWVREHNNPDVKFLLENVKMKTEWIDTMTSFVGVDPIHINSALLSAQKRPRVYWSNFEITQPKDAGILLKDIILDDVHPPALHDMYGRWGEHEPRAYYDKSPAIRPNSGGGHIPYLILSDNEMEYMNRQVKDGRTHWNFNHHSDVKDNKSSAVVANFRKGVPYNVLITEKCVRKFDPIECERLQTFEDGYTAYGNFDGRVKKISNHQRYKALGNSWTVDVTTHILKGLHNGS